VLAYAGTIARFAVTQQARCGPGRIVENTIEYAASAGDAETVAELLDKSDRDFLSSRQIGQLLRCGRWLPAELLHAMGVPHRQERSVAGVGLHPVFASSEARRIVVRRLPRLTRSAVPALLVPARVVKAPLIVVSGEPPR
jgi:hypothetical protein